MSGHLGESWSKGGGSKQNKARGSSNKGFQGVLWMHAFLVKNKSKNNQHKALPEQSKKLPHIELISARVHGVNMHTATVTHICTHTHTPFHCCGSKFELVAATPKGITTSRLSYISPFDSESWSPLLLLDSGFHYRLLVGFHKTFRFFQVCLNFTRLECEKIQGIQHSPTLNASDKGPGLSLD